MALFRTAHDVPVAEQSSGRAPDLSSFCCIPFAHCFCEAGSAGSILSLIKPRGTDDILVLNIAMFSRGWLQRGRATLQHVATTAQACGTLICQVSCQKKKMTRSKGIRLFFFFFFFVRSAHISQVPPMRFLATINRRG